jgi:hypothetical protein
MDTAGDAASSAVETPTPLHADFANVFDDLAKHLAAAEPDDPTRAITEHLQSTILPSNNKRAAEVL